MKSTALVAVVGTAACCACVPSVLADLPVSKWDLLAAWELNWAPVRDLEVVCEWRQEGSLAGEGQPIASLEMLSRWDGAGVYNRAERVGSPPLEESFSYVSGEGRSCLVGQGPYRVRRGPFDTGNVVWMAHQLRCGAPAGAPGAFPDLSALLADECSALRPEPEMVGERSTAVLDVRNTQGRLLLTVWVDLERAVPLRWGIYDAHEQPSRTVELADYACVAGVWLPLEIQLLCDGYASVQRVRRDELGNPRIRINGGFGDGGTTVRFPPKALVVDQDTHEVMRITAGGKDLRAVSAQLAGTLRPHLPSDRAPSGRPGWSMGGLLVTAMAVGAGVRLWRGR